MKIKTVILSALLVAVAGTAHAYRSGALSGVGFQAPWMTDHTYADAEKGDIVYNTSEDIFYGKTASGWTPFDAANPSLWYIDVTMAGASVALSTGAVGSYTSANNSGLAISMNLDSDTAQIACASGTSSSGTTCSGADENVGIAFNIPRAGTYKVCVIGAHSVATNNPGTTSTAFQLGETANNSHTITNYGNAILSTASTSNSTLTFPLHICGSFKFTTTGQKTVRLFYVQSVTGTVSSNAWPVNISFNWTVTEIK